MNGYTYIASPGQPTIGLTPINNVLTIASGGAIGLVTSPTTNTLTMNLSSSNLNVTNFTVTGTLTLNPTLVSTLDNITIGSITPAPATFTSLTVTGAVNMNPTNANITISPTGTGTLIINPNTTGTIDNIAIGSNVPAAGNFTSITIAGTQPTSLKSVVTKGYVAALSAAYGVALS
jgi:hypothetical protein